MRQLQKEVSLASTAADFWAELSGQVSARDASQAAGGPLSMKFERVFDRVVVICSSATSTGLSSGAGVNTSCARHLPGGGAWGDLQPRVAVMDTAALDARFKPAIDYVINAEPHGPARGFHKVASLFAHLAACLPSSACI